MSTEKVVLAPLEVVEERKRAAEAAAAQNGHEIGHWHFVDGEHPQWKGVCLHSGCQSRMTVNPKPNGIWVGITATSRLAKCPYKSK